MSETVVLELPASVYADMESLAETEQTEPTTHAFRRILERATDLGVPDLAEQHDHYLYGVDKK